MAPLFGGESIKCSNRSNVNKKHQRQNSSMSSDEEMYALAAKSKSVVSQRLQQFRRELTSKRKLRSSAKDEDDREANAEAVESKPRKQKPLRVEYEDDRRDNADETLSKNVSEDNSEEPENWQRILRNIEEMRSKRDAPVDTMGCDRCMDDEAQPRVYRWQALVSLMLSSQTKDSVTYEAMNKLKNFGLTIENVLSADDKTLEELIYPVGFYKKKAQYLKRTAQILKDDYKSDIPSSATDLCNLPGVGPKMAHLCMKVAWGRVTGIGVDTHVHRIANRLRWVKTKTPNSTRVELEKWLPKELWHSVNSLLVGFGQQICTPVNPKCDACLNKNICPASKLKSEPVK